VTDGPGEGRRRRLTTGSDARFGLWADSASEDDFNLVAEVLMHVVEDNWPDHCRAYLDPTHDLRFHIEARRGLIVSVHYMLEYPSQVQVVFIGEPGPDSPAAGP